MNGWTLNTVPLNGRLLTGQVVLLPSATASLEWTVFERASVSLAAFTGISFAAAGDIAKGALISAAATGISLSAIGSIDVYSRVPLGMAGTGIAFGLAGVLNGDSFMPASGTALQLSASGTLTNYAQMQGSSSLAFAATAAAPGLIQYLQAGTALSLDVTATLYTVKRMEAVASGISFATTGQVGTTALLTGMSDVRFSLSAELSNNPNAHDADDKIAVRAYVDRVARR